MTFEQVPRALRSLGMTKTLRSLSTTIGLVVTGGSLFAQGPGVTAVRFGSLIDGTGRVVRDAVVIINADTVVRVGSGASAVPAGARVIDLRRYAGIPGLIDAHTHISYFWDQTPGTDPWQQSGRRRSQVTVFLAQENARKTLETGVTTIRDLGASDYSDLAIRDLINRGAMVGPRVFAAGYGLRRSS